MQPDYVYFPGGYDDKIPQAVYKTRGGVKTRYTIMVTKDQSEAEEGRGKIVERSRLVPYTDEFWESCNEYIERRENRIKASDDEYKQLCNGQIFLICYAI